MDISSEVMEDGMIIRASAQPLSNNSDKIIKLIKRNKQWHCKERVSTLPSAQMSSTNSDNIIKLIKKNKQWYCKARASAANVTGHADDTDMSQYVQTCSGKFVATGVATGHADDVDVVPQQSKKANKCFSMTTFNNFVITVLVKNKKWQIYIPKKLHGDKRAYIQFSAQPIYGTLQNFGEFIFKSLQVVVNCWTDLKQARMWCADDTSKNAWKNHVQSDWLRNMRSRRKQKSEQNIDLEQMVTGTLAYNGFNDATIIRIPDYADTPKEFKTMKFHAIRVREQKATIKKHAYVYLRIPKYLIGSSKPKIISMGERFGIIPSWRNFVASYVRYALCNVDSFDALKQWCTVQLGHFRSLLQRLYDEEKKINCIDFWEIRPSQISTDESYVVNGSFNATSTGRGAGLFCKKPGEYDIPFGGISAGITQRVNKARERVSKLGGFYQVTVGGNFVDVPTDASFAAKVVHIGFIVNHRVLNPTHCLKIKRGQALLKPLRPAQAGEEFCFNYRYELSDDVPTQEE